MPDPRVHPMIDPLLRLGAVPAQWLAATQVLNGTLARLGRGQQAIQALREPAFGSLLAAPMASAMQKALGDLALTEGGTGTSIDDDPPPPAPGLLHSGFGAAVVQEVLGAAARAGSPGTRPTTRGQAAPPTPPRQPNAPAGPISADQARRTWQQRAGGAGLAGALSQALGPSALARRHSRAAAGMSGSVLEHGLGGAVDRAFAAAGLPAQGVGRDLAGINSLAGDTTLAGAGPRGDETAHNALERALRALAPAQGTGSSRAGRQQAAPAGSPGQASPRLVTSTGWGAAAAAALSAPSQGQHREPSATPADSRPQAHTTDPATPSRSTGLVGLRGLAARAAELAAASAGSAGAAPLREGNPDGPLGLSSQESPTGAISPINTDPTRQPGQAQLPAPPGPWPTALGDEQLAAQLARVLRREAQRDGIDVDDLSP